MIIGYIRVSRDSQITALQEDAMKREGCERVFTDKLSGKDFERPEFLRMMDIARAGDVIVVWRLDRLSRRLKDLIEVVGKLAERGIELRSCKESIDTTTATGKLMFQIIGAMAEFERNVISERTIAGLEAARARGRKGGRKSLLEIITPAQLERARELYKAKELQVHEIINLIGVKMSRPSFYKYVVGK